MLLFFLPWFWFHVAHFWLASFPAIWGTTWTPWDLAYHCCLGHQSPLTIFCVVGIHVNFSHGVNPCVYSGTLVLGHLALFNFCHGLNPWGTHVLLLVIFYHGVNPCLPSGSSVFFQMVFSTQGEPLALPSIFYHLFFLRGLFPRTNSPALCLVLFTQAKHWGAALSPL